MSIVKTSFGIYYILAFPDLRENLLSDRVWAPLLYHLNMHLNIVDYRLEHTT